MDLKTIEKALESPRLKLYDTRLMREVMNGALPLEIYRGFLRETYHYVKHTTRFFVAAASRMSEEHEQMRKKLIEYAADESGHENYLLNDLRSVGIESDAVRHSSPLVETEALTGFHYYVATFGNPIGIWGNVYAVEGFSNDKAGNAARILVERNRLPRKSVTFLTSHGTFDEKHFRNAQQVLEKHICLPNDIEAVVYCARASLDLYATMYESIYRHYEHEEKVELRLA